eukprot:NODE_651_length_5002_cov_1.533347.p2 type:complete len:255 gc:universal NODE_651_length_5002_cov_1.533347:2679-1915(-)
MLQILMFLTLINALSISNVEDKSNYFQGELPCDDEYEEIKEVPNDVPCGDGYEEVISMDVSDEPLNQPYDGRYSGANETFISQSPKLSPHKTLDKERVPWPETTRIETALSNISVKEDGKPCEKDQDPMSFKPTSRRPKQQHSHPGIRNHSELPNNNIEVKGSPYFGKAPLDNSSKSNLQNNPPTRTADSNTSSHNLMTNFTAQETNTYKKPKIPAPTSQPSEELDYYPSLPEFYSSSSISSFSLILVTAVSMM